MSTATTSPQRAPRRRARPRPLRLARRGYAPRHRRQSARTAIATKP